MHCRPLRWSCGTIALGIQDRTSFIKFSNPLILSVINRLLTHASTVNWENMLGYPLLLPIHQFISHFHSFILMFGHHQFSNSGYKYYVVLIDAYTHYICTFPIRNKSEVQDIIRSFFSYVHTQFQLPILALQTDNGHEFDTHAMRHFLAAHGTCFRRTCSYTSQQNGKAERILRTTKDCIRTLLIHSAAPFSFWAEALLTATYVINRRPCRTPGTTTGESNLRAPALGRPCG